MNRDDDDETASAVSVAASDSPRWSTILVTTASGTFTVSIVAPQQPRPLPTVVCFHGFPDLAEPSFAPLANRLARQGYRVAIPHMRGYESATVQGPASRSGYFCCDLGLDVLEMIMALQVRQYCRADLGVVLVGHDWGSLAVQAAVASLYEAHYAETAGDAAGVLSSRLPKHIVRATVLLSVPPAQPFLKAALWLYPVQLLLSWYIFFFQLPWLPEYCIKHTSLLPYLWRRWAPDMEPALAKERAEAVRAHLLCSGRPSDVKPPTAAQLAEGTMPCVVSLSPASKHPRGDGVVAALGYYRCLLNLFHFKGRYSFYVAMSNSIEYLAARAVPTLAICGSHDGSIHPRVFEYCARNVRHLHGTGVSCETIPDVGHWPHVEAPDRVADFIVAFLDKRLRRPVKPQEAPRRDGD